MDEQLPPAPTLKVVHKRDPDYGLTEDERQDRRECIRCYLRKEFELLTMIPKQDEENGFFIGDYSVDDDEYNAFNTMDFHRQLKPFNKYGYAMKKIMERVKSLAIDHSSISDESGTQDYLWAIRETMGRVSEINGLTWDDVDFQQRVVTLYTRKKKGGHSTPRKVPMTENLYEVLSRRFAERDVNKDWVFWHRYWSRKEKKFKEGPYQDRKKIMKTS